MEENYNLSPEMPSNSSLSSTTYVVYEDADRFDPTVMIAVCCVVVGLWCMAVLITTKGCRDCSYRDDHAYTGGVWGLDQQERDRRLAEQLEAQTKQHNEIAGVGGSSVGLASGILGVAAACTSKFLVDVVGMYKFLIAIAHLFRSALLLLSHDTRRSSIAARESSHGRKCHCCASRWRSLQILQ